MLINLEWLKSRNACQTHIRIFSKEWPDGCELNRENLQRALDLGLSIDWLTYVMVSSDSYNEYNTKRNSARAKFERVVDPVYTLLRENLALLRAKANEKPDWTQNEYDEKRVAIYAVHREKCKLLEAEYAAKVGTFAIDTLIDYLSAEDEASLGAQQR